MGACAYLWSVLMKMGLWVYFAQVLRIHVWNILWGGVLGFVLERTLLGVLTNHLGEIEGVVYWKRDVFGLNSRGFPALLVSWFQIFLMRYIPFVGRLSGVLNDLGDLNCVSWILAALIDNLWDSCRRLLRIVLAVKPISIPLRRVYDRWSLYELVLIWGRCQQVCISVGGWGLDLLAKLREHSSRAWVWNVLFHVNGVAASRLWLKLVLEWLLPHKCLRSVFVESWKRILRESWLQPVWG